jgi:hypothetical protein
MRRRPPIIDVEQIPDGKHEVVWYSYVGGSRSVVEVQNPAGSSHQSFVLSAQAFEDLKARNPNITFREDHRRNPSRESGLPH